jgi:hypothetical protein
VYGPRPVQTAGGHWFTLFNRKVYQPARTPKIPVPSFAGRIPGFCRAFREVTAFLLVMLPLLRWW